MRRKERWMRCGAGLAVAAACLLGVTAADAQSKKSAKQAQSLEKAGESAKAAVQGALGDLRNLLTGYNAIIDGEAKNTQSAYKKLVSDLKGTGKTIEGARKQLASLNKEADKFFKAWEADLSSMSSDSMREKSANRMEYAKKRYASIGETLAKAREEFSPVIQNLNDQILYLGRDLSPEAVADLKDEAEALNQQAAEVAEKVEALLQSAGEAQTEADAELDAEEQG